MGHNLYKLGIKPNGDLVFLLNQTHTTKNNQVELPAFHHFVCFQTGVTTLPSALKAPSDAALVACIHVYFCASFHSQGKFIF